MPSTPTSSRIGYCSSSLPIAVTRLDDEGFSTSPLPCRTSTWVPVSLSTRMFKALCNQPTYPSNFVKVTRRVYPQSLGCDRAALVFTLPHIRVPTSVLWDVRSVVAKWDLQRSRKQSPVTACPAQSTQTLLPESWR